ncbi:MAG: methyltransferase domain-containing protein, partial [Candidatus Binatus sp.]
FESDTFDAIFCRAAFKNFSEPVAALKEMRRVLKPGATALIIDLRKDVSRAAIDSEVETLKQSALNAFFTRWIFRLVLIRRAYTRDQFVDFIQRAGFTKLEIRETRIGFEICLTK